MRFKYPLILITLIFPIFYFAINAIKIRKHSEIIGSIERFQYSDLKRQAVINKLLLTLSIIFTILALSGPQTGRRLKITEKYVKDIYLALDLSASMKANDVDGPRILRAKLDSLSIVNSLKGERVGLIIFSSNAYLYTPATDDYDIVIRALQSISEKTTVDEYTNLTSPILLFKTVLSHNSDIPTALIIFTDGEDNVPKFSSRAKRVKRTNINTLIVGIGSLYGSPIPVENSGNGPGCLKNRHGDTVITKLDIEKIKRLSGLLNGSYFISKDILYDSKRIIKFVRSVRSKTKKVKFEVKRDLFQIPLSLAILLIILYTVIIVRNRSNYYKNS